MSIFKAYDIRGIYPEEINEGTAEQIASAFATIENLKTVAVGRDARLSAPKISSAVIKGLVSAGVDVLDIGFTTTPMCYYTTGKYNLDGSIMVTASHNPPNYIGFKISRKNAIPLSDKTGLLEIKSVIEKKTFRKSNYVGSVKSKDVLNEYKKHILSTVDITIFEKVKRRVKIAVDTANGCVGPFFKRIFSSIKNVDFVQLFFEPDGNFPNHEPNPLKEKNLYALKDAVIKTKSDFGACFDGDGDRVIFVDENANTVKAYYITILIAEEILSREPHSHIIYDLRSSKVVAEKISSSGGKPIKERVGHAFIKDTMRKYDSPFGGELSGHFYFKKNFFTDSALLAFIYLLYIYAKKNHKFSRLIEPLKVYHPSGEINFHCKEKDEMIERLSNVFLDGKQEKLDGLSVYYDNWWFNVRKSNTEPLLRLNVEANTKEILDEKLKKFKEIIGESIL